MQRLAILLLIVSTVITTSAQGPRFEVASVKPSGPTTPWGIGRLPPGVWRARATVSQLIALSTEYGFEDRVVGGPKWIREDKFDIDARMDPKLNERTVGPLVLQLLADRFALRTHVEQRPIDVYLLKMARADGQPGPRLKRSEPQCVEAKMTRQQMPAECLRAWAGGLNVSVSQMSDLLRLLAFTKFERPIIDRTGLTGYYDLQLSASPGMPGPGGEVRAAAPSFFTALQEEAGLKLEPAREMVDVLVVDSVQMPEPD